MFLLLSIKACLAVAIVVTYKIIVGLPQFGKLPSGERLQRVLQSPHYKDGAFQNLSPTPPLAEEESILSVSLSFFFGKKAKDLAPHKALPAVKSDLKALAPMQNGLAWFGHSSYFLQVNGKTFLIDPVFSGAASPFQFSVKAFAGADAYQVHDLPAIDYLLITHDHWDHLDYQTVLQLRGKVKQIICGLGTGAHFEHWGFEPGTVLEKDWYESVQLDNEMQLTFLPGRHFSGRSLKRNTSLWGAFALKSPQLNLFLGGDSGYDAHFAEIGKKYGPFDLAIIENGQYDKRWPYIHLLPEQFAKAAHEINASRIFPVHSAKFALGNHPWYEPLQKVTESAPLAGIALITPMIGEWVNLDDPNQRFKAWWNECK